MKYTCFDIMYDTDSEYVILPTKLIVDVDYRLKGLQLEEALSDAISEKTGFCHFGFKFNKTGKKKKK